MKIQTILNGNKRRLQHKTTINTLTQREDAQIDRQTESEQ